MRSLAIKEKNGSVYLRSLTLADATQLSHLADDPELAQRVSPEGNFPTPYTPNNAVNFITYARFAADEGSEFNLGIFALGEDVLVGMVGLMKIDRAEKSARVGYWIGRDYRRRGYARDAVSMAASFAFRELSLEKLYAELSPDNRESLTFIRSLGFSKAGDSLFLLERSNFSLHDIEVLQLG